MSTTHPYRPPTLGLTAAHQIDAVCGEFEAAWQTDTRPDLAAFAARVPEAVRPPLLLELIQLDAHYRRKAGETPTAGEYRARFPELAVEEVTAAAETVPDDRRGADTPGGRTADNGELAVGMPGSAGRFRVLGEIARGGMGVVYRAFDPQLGREVAVKTLGAKVAGSNSATARFLDEARITARLQHPSVPPVHEIGELPDGRPYLAMKLVDGGTWADLLKRRGVADGSQAVGVFERVCQTVGFAHSRGVVHRDLKPANVMVGAFGEVQVMDWGLAKELGEPGDPLGGDDAADGGADRLETRIGSVLGTLAYMPPEQARGETHTLDRRADVFALGAILCEALTGRPAYVGDAEAVWAQATGGRVEGAFARLDGCGADPELVALAKRCLSPDAADRPADGAAVAAAVAAHRAGVEERLRTAERAAAAAAERRKRRRVQMALAVAVGLLAVGGGAFAWWQDRQESDRKLEQAQVNSERAAKAVQDQIAEERRATAELQRQGRNEQAIQLLLTECETALKAGLAEPASAALKEADRRATEGGADGLKPRLDRCRSDLALLRELDRIDELRWTWMDDKFQVNQSIQEWATLFYPFGIVTGNTDATAVARRVNDSLLADRLLAALDLWRVRSPSAELTAVLTAADPDPYRNAVRAGSGGITDLANRPDALAQPPRFAVVLDERKSISITRRKQILLAALRRQPNDLLVLMALGYVDRSRPAEAAGWYRAALAVRPANAAIWTNLGHAEYYQRHFDEAARCAREALRLNPDLVHAYGVLGVAQNSLGEVAAAIETYTECLRRHPDYPIAHNGLGMIAINQRRYVDGRKHMEEALRLDPDLAVAHNNLGLILEAEKRPREAIASYEKALGLESNMALANYNLGRALNRINPVRAEGLLKTAVRTDPQFAAAYLELGKVQADLKKMGQAVESFQESRRLDPKPPAVHYFLGWAMHDTGATKDAIASFEEAVRRDEKYFDAHLRLARAYRDLPDPVRAAESYRKAAELNPSDETVRAELEAAVARSKDGGKPATAYDRKRAITLGNRGRELVAARKTDEAIRTYQEAIAADPTVAWVHYYLANLLKKEKPGQAIDHYREAIQLNSKYAEAHVNLAIVLEAQGDIELAIDHLKKGTATKPSLMNAQYMLGGLLFDKGNVAEALARFEVVIQADPKYALGHYMLGNCQRELGNAAPAEASFREALRLDNAMDYAHNNLGNILKQRGQSDEAIECYERALRINPNLPQAKANLADIRKQMARREERAGGKK